MSLSGPGQGSGTGEAPKRSEGQSSDMDEDSKSSKSSRAPKGRVWLDRLVVQRAKGIVKEVNFNSKGQPAGDVATEMQSYIGVLTRRHVKITYKTWWDVPSDTKELIWEEVKSMFKVPDTWKKKCLISAATKCRQWKSHLYTKHIEPFEDHPEMIMNPPPDSGIRKEDWKEFVISRMSETARQQSAESRKRLKNNIYPHKMSRKGYNGLEVELEQKGKLTGNPVVDRAIKWRFGRANSDGDFDEVTQSIIEKIDHCIEKYEAGEFSQNHPTDDILTQALGTSEHSGRVRGVGAYVTPTVYFNMARGRGIGVGNIVQEMRKEFGKQLAEMSAKILELQQHMMKKEVEEEKGSCSNKNPSVNKVHDDYDVVEVPPENVIPRSKALSAPNEQIKLKSTEIPKPLRMLHSYAIHALKDKQNRGIRIPFDENVFGHELLCHIFYGDIHHFCELEPISASCICVYTWLLYKECENSNLLSRFRFVNPYQISHDPNVSATKKDKIIAERLVGVKPNQLTLVPCNVGFHWILMVIDAHEETVFVLDPLHDEAHFKDWKPIMTTAIRMFNATIGKRNRDVLWEDIICQQQPDGKQCGFYVMRYMKDLIENCGSEKSIPIPMLFSEGFYSKKEIDDVRKEWAEFVSDFTDDS